MKDINNIEDWYRDELSNYNVEPNKNGWDSLADELDANTPLTDDNISEWYKKEAEKLEERPDFTVWEKLSTQLDTASVWEKLSVSLTRYEQFIWWRNVTIRGTAIFLLFAGSYISYQKFSSNNLSAELNNTDPTNDIPKKESSSLIKNELKTSLNTYNINKEIAINSNTINDREEIQRSNSQIQKHPINKRNKSIKNQPLLAKTDDILKVKAISFPQENDNTFLKRIHEIQKKGITEKDITTGFEKTDFLVKKKKNKIVFNNKRFSSHFAFGVYARRFYLGVNFGIKKQGMLTALKNNPGLGKFQQEHFLDFGKTLGGTLGWIVSDKLNVETNLNFISSAGYNSAFKNENGTYEEELNLNYTTLSILAKKMSNKSTFDNKKYSTNLIGGLYTGYLTTSSAVINGKTTSNNTYNNMDFGVVLGIEQDRYITKSLIITPGFRYQQGLLNVANDASSFQSARNFSIEFNLGIKYIFLKKG